MPIWGMQYILTLILICLTIPNVETEKHLADVSPVSFSQKIEGLLMGSLYGDALGGPLEFAEHPKCDLFIKWGFFIQPHHVQTLRTQISLSDYPIPAAPYGPWKDQAPAGTVTDDSRMKFIFFRSIGIGDSLSSESLAKGILTYGSDFHGRKAKLNQEWLQEFRYAAKWHLRMEGGLPPDRMWAGKPSMAGQMVLLPLAGFRPYDLDWTYRKAWEMDFFDTGMAKDFQAAIVTGLAAALQNGASWTEVEAAMRETDPYGYGKAEFSHRKVIYWLDFAHEAVREAEGRPKKLFEILERDLQAETWWECWIPLVVSVACLDMVDHDPLAAMELARQFGHDTDSYLQLLGAIVGALHGVSVFPVDQIQRVKTQINLEYGVCVEDWMRIYSIPITKG